MANAKGRQIPSDEVPKADLIVYYRKIFKNSPSPVQIMGN
jgi:hypothetical protein